MFKRMFQFTPSGSVTTINGRVIPANSDVEKLAGAVDLEQEKIGNGSNGTAKGLAPLPQTFEDVYKGAGVQAGPGYSILKVSEMLGSKHLADMTPDAKRNSLMMALEAGGAEIGGLLQDAVARNRALDEYEEHRVEQMKAFEAGKGEENAKLQAEIDRLTSQYMSRIQANLDQIAQEQDHFRSWQKRKHQESQRITDAATFCVPQGSGVSANGLSAVLERVGSPLVLQRR